ncbi:MAG: hypothetical protein HKK66_11165 [Chlorobiaceae bacterium]|nr:hypothetical protein [Chlorobiaceae bacterium]
MKKVSLLIMCLSCVVSKAYGDVYNTNATQFATTNATQSVSATGVASAYSYGIGNVNTAAGGAGGAGGYSTSYASGGSGGSSYATGGNATGGNATGGNATGGTSSASTGASTATTGASTASTGASTSVNGGNTLVLKSGDTIVPQQLLGTVAQTDNPHLYSIQGGMAQSSNLNLLLAQSWSPDHRDTADGKSCKTTIVCVTDYNIEKYKGAGANNFIFLDEKSPVPPGLGSITISPHLNKGDEVDGSTLKSDIKTYVCNKYHGLNIYIKSSWAASSFGVHSKGLAAQAMSSASFFPGNVVSGLAGALGGNKGATEAVPIVSLTVILSDK